MRHQRHGLDTRHVTWMKGDRSILFAKKQKTNKQTKKQKQMGDFLFQKDSYWTFKH